MTNISNSDWIKISINIFVGFLTILMKAFVPIGGGGISLIFVLTIPFTLGLSILSSLLYFYQLADFEAQIFSFALKFIRINAFKFSTKPAILQNRG